MPTLRIKAPDGKTLAIQAPEGTDPSKYDQMVEEAIQHYKTTAMDPRYLEGKMADGSNEYPSTWQTNYQPAADLYLTGDAAINAPAAIKAGIAGAKALPGIGRAMADGLSDIPGTISKGASAVGDAISGGWDAMTGNTPRGFGYAKGVLKTPGMRDAASDAIDMANSAQPELGKTVAEAGAPADALPPEGGIQPSPEFQTPIRQGILTGSEDMFNAAETQRQAVGKAIEQTLSKYDDTGSFYDPSKVNEQVKSMLERDAAGNVMTTGWQGDVNEAMKKALSSLSDFSQGSPIKWSDAARIKTGLQGDTNYAVAGFNKANEAYKQVASLLKNDIDEQAAAMLEKQGGNVANYQSLRQAYGKLESLSEALNNRVAAKTANSTIPWWVKMGAGAALGATGTSIIKGVTGHYS